MISLGRWAARRWAHPCDLDGWTAVEDGDPRTPAAETGRRGAGPWVVDGRRAHGLYERPHPSGMVDWAAAYRGWMLWRWRGPRMYWLSPLVSCWNPILAQDLVLDELDWFVLCWPDDADEWTAAAILEGRKTAGYFKLQPRARMRAWLAEARDAGLEVEPIRHSFGAVFAARAGSLGGTFDLAGLGDEYRRVLPGAMGEQAARDLVEHAGLPLIRAAVDHERYPEVVCGLALGYPPEVTAGLLASEEHRRTHPPEGAEFGAYCPFCEGPRRRESRGTAGRSVVVSQGAVRERKERAGMSFKAPPGVGPMVGSGGAAGGSQGGARAVRVPGVEPEPAEQSARSTGRPAVGNRDRSGAAEGRGMVIGAAAEQAGEQPMVFKVPDPVGAAGEVVPRGWEFAPGWRLLEVRKGDEACEKCGESVRTRYVICDSAGPELGVGRRCVEELTGWTVTEAEAVNKLAIAERDRTRAEVWARFAQEFPEDAAMVESDVAAYEREAPSTAGFGASHEIRDFIRDFFARGCNGWVLDRVARYRARRVDFWWVRHG